MFTSIAMQCDSASNLKITPTIWHMNKVRQRVSHLNVDFLDIMYMLVSCWITLLQLHVAMFGKVESCSGCYLN